MILPSRYKLEEVYYSLNELKQQGSDLNSEFSINNQKINDQYFSNQINIDAYVIAKERILKQFLCAHQQIQEEMKEVGNLELDVEYKQKEDSLEISESDPTQGTHSQQEPLPLVTYITVKYNAGYGNFLSICGTGPNMSWDPEKALLLRCIGKDLWVYETSSPFDPFQFKVLLNNKTWEKGPDHTADKNSPIEFSPRFPVQETPSKI